MDYPKMYLDTDPPKHLSQGDIFRRFPGKVLPRTKPKEAGFLVASYTCDFINPKELNFISICPVHQFEVAYKRYIERFIGKNEENFKNAIESKLDELANYKPTFLFFLSPRDEFNGEPAYADLGQVFSIPKLNDEIILKNRFAVLKSPWREKLGYKLGNMYNRVATKDIDRQLIKKYAFDTRSDLLPDFNG